MVLQACNDAGIAIPQYCYHPGLSIPASCRICLVEVEGIPKLVPSCQTPVRDGMVVHSKSPKAVANQKQVMEYLLINHPLDCPVCDQAGECYLQDYSYEYGRSQSPLRGRQGQEPQEGRRREHLPLRRPLHHVHALRPLHPRGVSGTSELYVDGRGNKEEIDIFPGRPVNNKLAGNVVDLCPVGALLDKDFLFKQRVWLLKQAPSISPADSGGENIYLEYNEGIVYRIKPRYNADVNQWWISDDTRYSYKAVHDEKRLTQAAADAVRHAGRRRSTTRSSRPMPDLKASWRRTAPGSLYAVLSPMMACEEAWLLGQAIRRSIRRRC